eukprot:c9238_g1_i1.p1 GENE.c9238_g1_i1~~c9238_g1_i1.p1  ORF type:complete len:439 (+),score=81.52 c9238_g1_i1:29-1318(+)
MNQTLANVKSSFEGDIRRFKLDGSLERQGLVSKISGLYGIAAENIVVKYADDEGDLVTIGCDEDLALALEVCPQLLKLTVTISPVTANSSPPTEPTCSADRVVPYVLKNGARVTLTLSGDAVQKLGLSALADSELETRISHSKLRDLVLVGLVSAETARQICESHDLKVPKSCREGFESHHGHGRGRAWRTLRETQTEEPEPGVFGRGRGFGHWRGRGRGRGRWHPFAHHTEDQIGGESGDTPTELHGSARMRARFVKHVTVENDSVVNPGDEFTKTWRVRNESSVAWPENVELVVVGGDVSLAVQPSVTVHGGVPPNTEADVSVACRAPTTAGNYQTFWRLKEVDGRRFGQRLGLSVMVGGATTSSDVQSDFEIVGSGSEFATQMKRLKDFGLEDSESNARLLARFKGNVERVVAHTQPGNESNDPAA